MWNEPDQKDDRELIARCREGDASAFEALVGKYQQQVLNLVYHYIGNKSDVEDIAQKIFIKIYFSIPKFDLDRPFIPWLYRISINQCYDELRHLRRGRTYTFSELSLEDGESIEKLIAQGENTSNPQEDRSNVHDLLQRMLDQLSDRHRQIIVLRDLEGVSYGEIAAILKCSEQAARLKVFRARNRLRKIVEKALKK